MILKNECVFVFVFLLYDIPNVFINVERKKVKATVPWMRDSLMAKKHRQTEYAYGKLKKYWIPVKQNQDYRFHNYKNECGLYDGWWVWLAKVFVAKVSNNSLVFFLLLIVFLTLFTYLFIVHRKRLSSHPFAKSSCGCRFARNEEKHA